jgi:tetratricopeptide (TPR) repeat protein
LTLRVLVCIEDNGVAHVVAARLMKDGVDAVVVDKPSSLLEEAKKGLAALAVQDRYPSGEAATSLLRQLRVARAETVPAIVLLTGDIPAGDRMVLEKRYKVREFIRIAENPIRIAQAVGAAAGNVTKNGEADPTEERNEFDINVESVSAPREAPKASPADRRRLREADKKDAITAPPNASVAALTEESGGLLDVSQLPPPGGDADVELLQEQKTSVQRRPSGAAPHPISVLAPPDPGEGPPRTTKAFDEGDSVQTQPQDFQKAQNELKKALIAERKQREAAQKRVEELEAKLAKVGDIAPKSTSGVPSEGVFEDIRYPALLARCRADAFTGAIMMQSGGASRNVYLKDGIPIAFHSSEPGERIGKVLVTQGRISDAQYMQATTRSVERSIKLTDALVELGWMDAETIGVEQRNLARDQIISSFELVQGRFTVQQGAVPDANTATFEFGPGEVYVQGYRRYAPNSEMMAAYETLREKYLIANARLASYRPKLGLTGEDERLLRVLGEALVIEEAVERAQVTPEAAARLLSALQALELIEEWSPGVEQFRSRIRGEKQRHAEEINGVMAEARQREQRLLDAFEKALSKLGAGSINAHLDGEPPAKAASRSPTFSPSASSATSASSPSRPLPSSPSSAAASSSSSASAATPASSAPSSSHSSPPASSPGPSASPAAQAVSAGVVVTPRAPPSPAVAPSEPAPTSKKAIESPPSMSVADLKYREGVEQAAASRLDEAEITLREAVRLDASKPEYLTELARVLLGNPRYERAGTLPVVRSLLDRAVQIAPDFQEAVDLHKQVIKEMTT